MSTRFFLGDFTTGQPKDGLPVLAGGDWSDELGSASVAVDLPWQAAKGLQLDPWKSYLCAEVDGLPVAAGPWTGWDYGGDSISLHASGAEVWWDVRYIMHNEMAAHSWEFEGPDGSLSWWQKVDFASPSWESLIQKVAEYVNYWPASPPIQTAPETVGPATAVLEARSTMQMSTWLDDIRRKHGVEFDLLPIWQANGWLAWRLKTAQKIGSGRTPSWTVDPEAPGAARLQRVHFDGSNVITHQHMSGGRSVDKSLVATANRASAGMPMVEAWDGSNSQVDNMADLLAMAVREVNARSAPKVEVTFDVPLEDVAHFSVGDYCDLWVNDGPWLGGRLRIVKRSGSLNSNRMTIEAVQGGDRG